MGTYKIIKVAPNPREWKGDKGTTYYITVALMDTADKKIHPKGVSVGKKKPDALAVGQTIEGDIIPDPDHKEDKWKGVAQPFGGGGGKSNFIPKDEAAIKAMWAIGQAVQLYIPQLTSESRFNEDELEGYATDLFHMVERVKASNPPVKEPFDDGWSNIAPAEGGDEV